RAVQLDHVPDHLHHRDRTPRPAHQPRVQPAGDGHRGRCDRAPGAGHPGRPHRHPAGLRRAAGVLRLHRVVRPERLARRSGALMPAARTAIACFGEALIDFLAEPEAADGRPPRFACNAGGAPANVAVGIARLAGTARFAGMLATAMFGDLLLGALDAHGVDTTVTRRTDAAPTALAFVSLAAGGERSFSFYRPPAADLLFTVADFDDDLFAGLAAFHACSNSLTEPDIAA